MSGHNKWSKIKNKKAVEDAKKSKIFSMLSRAITIESKKSGGDKNSPNLKAVIDRARAANMPNDNIDRAVKKGVGNDAGNFEEVIYEAYGPGGSAIIIEGITDNKNRTTPEIKHILSKNSGNLGAQGSVSWAFEKTNDEWVAINKIEISETEKDKLTSLIEELEEHDDIKEIYTNIS